MPPEWAERILGHDEKPLWSAGWIPVEPQEDLQALAPHQHQGWAFTLDATPSAYDQRSQVWVFGLCVHQALLAGLVALARHTTTPVSVIVQLTAVWEVWTQPRHRPPFQDLLEQVTAQDFTRVTVVYVCRNTRHLKHLATSLS